MRPSIAPFLLLALLASACGRDRDRPPVMMVPDGGIDTDAGIDEVPETGTLKSDAPVSFSPLYEAGSFTAGPGSAPRGWIPVDITPGPRGELWIIQRAERATGFDDVTECTERGAAGAANDCVGLLGSTVAIADPRTEGMATSDNGRADEVSDFNSWHFMRRPSAIAFGDPEVVLSPDDPAAQGPSGERLFTEPQVYTDTFATCAEHGTGNYTDAPPFIGPSLWTADPAIYDGGNGTEEWANGRHLDMVHATRYCMGIAWERDNVYWTFNGELGTLDKYDFVSPHPPGHFYHDDAIITRYVWDTAGLARVPDVPSNMVIDGNELFIADTGNGRIVRYTLDSETTERGTFSSFEGIVGNILSAPALTEVATAATLQTIWGAVAEPSGLAVLDAETLVVTNHATGHMSLISRVDGSEVRTLDTGMGPGLGGATVIDGVIYAVHTTSREVVRVDVQTTP